MDITDLLTEDDNEPAFHLRGIVLGVTLGLIGWVMIIAVVWGVWSLAT